MMKKKLFIAAAVVFAAAAIGACSNQNTANPEQPAAEAQTEQESAAEVESSVEDESISESEEAAEEVSEETAEEASEGSEKSEEKLGEVNSVDTKILNKTGKDLQNVNIKLSNSLIGLGTLKDGQSAKKGIPADEDGFVLTFETEAGETHLPIGKEALGFKLVISADDADGYLTDIVGIDEED